MQKNPLKKPNPVNFSAQVGNFNTNYTSKVEIVLTELDSTNIVMRDFHVDDLQVNHRNGTKIYLSFPNNTIRVNVGTYE